MVVIVLVSAVANKLHLVGDRAWISFWVQIAASIALGYVFHLCFERPFISTRARKREAQVNELVAASPRVSPVA